MMWIGIILAGDGVVEAAIAFDTRTEAEDQMNRLLLDHYDPTFDRVLISLIQPYDEVVNELVEAGKES